MGSELPLFGPLHLAVIVAVPGSAWALARFAGGGERRCRCVARGLAVMLAVNEIIWYAFRLRMEGFRFPEALPLNLCDVTLWLTVAAALSHRPLCYELAWFWGVAGSGMAVLTPDLWAPCFSYPTIYFFLAHGGAIATLLYLVLTRLARPRRGAFRRALVGVNLFALLVGLFNLHYGTNYMFLCEKPAGASLLDRLGPWPWYLLGGEAVAVALFWLLWLPFRRINSETLSTAGRSV